MLGEENLHGQADFMRQARKKKEQKSDKKVRSQEELQTWDPAVMGEHTLHLEALHRSRRTQGIKIQGSSGFIVGAQANEPAETPSERINIMDHQIQQELTPGGYGVTVPMRTFQTLAALLLG
jgi:hypothetical protein